MLRDDFIDDAVSLGLLGRHDEIAFHIFFDLFDGLARVVRQQLIERGARP